MFNNRTPGIKTHILEELNEIKKMNMGKDFFVKKEILEQISKISSKINKEISLTINRNGEITDLSIGDSSSASISDIKQKEKKLSGFRVIHTHPNGVSKLSEIDLSALIELKLDSIIALGLDSSGKIIGINFAFCKIKNNLINYEEFTSKDILAVETFDYLSKIKNFEKKLKNRVEYIEDNKEKAILVGREDMESLLELKELAKACEIETIDIILQKGNTVDKSFYIGKGKVLELIRLKQTKSANLIIFDEELSGIQIKNLEEATNCNIIDRTYLILEIFSRRSKTRESKIQIKLALLKYKSSRLIGFGSSLSRIGGGIGNRGLGETKLELDRRNIKDKISFLKKELEKVKNIRSTQRDKRENSGIIKVSLVGYTNVGKSTLRNLIINKYKVENETQKEDVLAKDMLFATLDTTTRVIRSTSNREIAFTDTIGFIRKLPHDLIEAFKSTLEEVIFSDILIHVVDASSKNILKEIKVVESVLEDLKAKDKPTILALNKSDLLSLEDLNFLKEHLKNYKTIEISAKNNENIDALLNLTSHFFPNNLREVEYLVPYNESTFSSYLHNNANILEEKFMEDGIKIKAIVSEKIFNKYKKFTNFS